MKFTSIVLVAKLFVRYSAKHKLLFLFSSSVNAVSSLIEALVSILLPLIIGKYLGTINNEWTIPFLQLATEPHVFFLCIAASFCLKNYSLHLSSRYSASISCSYLDDFCKSFYGQDIDNIKKTTKENLSAIVQGHFPLIGREVFFPSTQILSSLLFIIITLISVFSLDEIDASLLTVLLLIMVVSYTLSSILTLKQLVQIGSQVKSIVLSQGNLVGLFHNSSLDDAYSTKPLQYSRLLCNNDTNLKRIQAKSVIFTSLPKSLTEALLIVVTVSISLIASSTPQLTISSSSLIGIFYILFKLLTSVQQLSRSFFLLKSNSEILSSIESKLQDFKSNQITNYINFKRLSNPRIIMKAIALQFKSRSVRKSLDFSIYDGDICLLDAPSGTGKTRLIYTLSGKLPPVSGRIIFNHLDSSIASSPFLIAQKQQLISGTVNDLLGIGQHVETIDILEQISESFHIDLSPFTHGIGKTNTLISFLNASSHDLSGGQLQRVLMLKAFTCGNSLIILDEPTSNLDSISELNCLQELFKYVMQKPSTALLYTSHSQNAKQLANKYITLG